MKRRPTGLSTNSWDSRIRKCLIKKVSYEHKEVRVVLIGSEVPDASISIARSKLKEYKLEDTKLIVLQGMNNEAVDVSSIRAMVMEDFYKNSEQRLQEQKVKITQLETTLQQYKSYDEMSRTLVPELKVLYPSITTLSIAHSLEVRVDSMKTDTVTLAVMKFAKHPTNTEKEKISEWLKARVGAKKVEVDYRIKNLKNNSMKFRLTAVIVLALCLSNAFADEGMWLLGNLKKNKQTDRVMRELGLQMPVNKLYNPKKPCLADAVVSFGGFCSGVVVSEDGLVFTNHHCGFSSIQQHSSVEHDYLKDGFVARSLEEELPNPELYVRFLLRTENVTKRVLSAAKHAKTESERRVAVDSVMNVIGMEVSEKDSTLTGIVDAYYAGNEFWLSVYRDYNDVRLVFAPPFLCR